MTNQKRGRLRRSAPTAPLRYLGPKEVNLLAEAALRSNRKGERDKLLIDVLFQTGLRISEALSLTVTNIHPFEGKYCLQIMGKGRKPRRVACPTRLVERLHHYATRRSLKADDPFFPISRKRGWQIIHKAATDAGLKNAVYPHLLRHSDAIERLRQTGNPKALQHHLGHASPLMTLRYLSTLQEEDSLRIQQKVEFE